MRDKISDVRQAEILGTQAAEGIDADRNSMAETSGVGAVGESEPIRTGGTVREGGTGRRLKPTTHGKTLEFLMRSLADQIDDSRQNQEREIQRQQRLQNQLEQLQSTLNEWRDRVNSLSVDSAETDEQTDV
jgi:TolA-binding protein